MTSYYPSQASYGGHHHHHHSHGQPVVYSNPSYGYGGVPASGVVYVSPSSRSYTPAGYYTDYDDYDSHRHRPRRRRSSRHHSGRYSYHPSYAYSGVPVSTVAAPPVVMQQPSQVAYGYQGYPQQWTFGQRVRRFFGLAPTPHFKYRSDRNSWGFMGYSRRQRYVDARTGMEVDRDGRPVIRA